jgi:hypothetical protein
VLCATVSIEGSPSGVGSKANRISSSSIIERNQIALKMSAWISGMVALLALAAPDEPDSACSKR